MINYCLLHLLWSATFLISVAFVLFALTDPSRERNMHSSGIHLRLVWSLISQFIHLSNDRNHICWN